MKHSQTHAFWRSVALCFLSSTVLALLTFICFRLHALPSVAALLYMVVIVLVSLQGRFVPAIFASIVAISCLDYFFVKPVLRITLAESLDVVALVAYLTTALVVTGLLSRARMSLRELRHSEARLAEGERLSRTGSWTWSVSNHDNVYWSAGHSRIYGFDPQDRPVSYQVARQRIHPGDLASLEESFDQAVRERKVWEFDHRITLPDASIKYIHTIGRPVVNESGNLVEYVGTAMDVTEQQRSTAALERALAEVKGLNAELRRTNEELRIQIGERKQAQEALRVSEQQRIAQLAKANEALRGCLDTLAQVPELDDFLGQVMAAITRQLGAVFSTLRMLDVEQNRLTLELVFQEDRVLSPVEAGFPEAWRSVPPDEQHLAAYQAQPTTVTRLLDPQSPTPEGLRDYLLGLGIKTGLIIPLTSGRRMHPLTSSRRMHGLLALYFHDERDFDQEELEIARALATQAGLAIHLTRLAKTARQSAVLEERNRLAGEIHDSLAQSFAGISMQLFAAQEVIKAMDDDSLGYIERANDLACFGLAEARRSALSLRSDIIEESGLIEALQMLVERSNIPGRLRCNFRSNGVRKESVPLHVQHDLLRIAQEAISNALRHAKATVLSVSLRLNSPNLVLEIRDNGSGIDNAGLESGEGMGLGNMRGRAKKIGAELDIRTAAARGTSVIVRLPINS
jgi:signal transduction histidine kinase/PAS domain-containing protein